MAGRLGFNIKSKSIKIKYRASSIFVSPLSSENPSNILVETIQKQVFFHKTKQNKNLTFKTILLKTFYHTITAKIIELKSVT